MRIASLTSIKEAYMSVIKPKFKEGDTVSHISPTIDFTGIARRMIVRPGTRETIVLVESESKTVWIPISLLEKIECQQD